MPAAARRTILGPNGKPFPATGPARPHRVRGRYDSAQTVADNRNHWSWTDAYSARVANDADVRKKLRERCRYEVANNSYAKGIGLTLANDTIGTGPRLQLLTPDPVANRAIERAFLEWADAIGLAEKLRTMRLARYQDGEAFGVLIDNPRLPTPVHLDLKLVEADQVATPDLDPFDPEAVDGIVFDPAGNPVAYHVLKFHPGDSLGFGLASAFAPYDVVPASAVVHWFRKDRPGVVRGVPDITPALPLFAQLRRYTLAVIAAAETAADFAAVLESDAPPDTDDAVEGEPFEEMELSKRLLTNLPAGHRLNQLKAEQPATTYEMFKREILKEIARCLDMPYNVAGGDSAGYNYASGRLDHQVYFRAIKVEQSHVESALLDRLLLAWLREAALASAGDLPVDRGAALRDYPRQWFWDGQWHVDPLKEATAQQTRLANNTTTLANEYAARGLDWETQVFQRAKEVALLARLGLNPASPPDPAALDKLLNDPEEDDGNQTEAARQRRALVLRSA